MVAALPRQPGTGGAEAQAQPQAALLVAVEAAAVNLPENPTIQDARERVAVYGAARLTAEAELASLREGLPQVVAWATAAGLSQSEVARLAGVSRETVVRAAGGRRG